VDDFFTAPRSREEAKHLATNFTNSTNFLRSQRADVVWWAWCKSCANRPPVFV